MSGDGKLVVMCGQSPSLLQLIEAALLDMEIFVCRLVISRMSPINSTSASGDRFLVFLLRDGARFPAIAKVHTVVLGRIDLVGSG